MLTLCLKGVDDGAGTDPYDPSRLADPTAIEGPSHPLVFSRRQTALVRGVSEKHVPRAVSPLTPITLCAMTLRAIPHDIDTLALWTMDRSIGHRRLLCGI